MKKHLSILATVFTLTGCSILKTDSRSSRMVKIMPVGDSITAGEHFRLPPIDERTGYRKPLYDLLKAGNHSFDFVGSTMHGRGISVENRYDWNSESYPGWDIEKISDAVLKKLPVYDPDILLVHMGTNGPNWDEKPRQLARFLDGVNGYAVANNKEITVFLALILNQLDGRNRKVSAYNQRVKEMVSPRRDQGIRIILVDIENGAGIDYTDRDPDPATGYAGGDMWGRKHPEIPLDDVHPNDRGYQKMARKWYRAMQPYL